jgi:hypothetical protein
MKAVTGILILTNVVLAGVVVALLVGSWMDPPRAATTSAPEITVAPAESLVPTQPTLIAPKPDPFRWSQIESTDYRTYVANLRGIGCPEQTIRDIVTADVDEAFYVPKREELKQKEPAEFQDQALSDLKRREDAFIASLLGTDLPPEDAATTNTVASSQRHSRGPTEVAVKMPLVLQNIDPAVVGVNTNLLSAIDTVRQRFLREIGSQADPNDPAYRERWLKAQADADSQLRGAIGLRAYQAYEYQARRVAASQMAAQSGANP